MEHHEVLIVGGGNAGISLAARLLRDGAQDVAVVESESVHRYRPLLNYVGAGEATMASLERPAATVMPEGCTWIQDQVVAVEADGPSVLTRDGRRIGCTTLVLCPGLEEDWDATPGLAEAYAAGWAGSTFVVESAPRVWPALRDLSRRPRGLHDAARAGSLRRDRPQAALHGVRPLAACRSAAGPRRAPGPPGAVTSRSAEGRPAARADAGVVRRAGAARGPGHRRRRHDGSR